MFGIAAQQDIAGLEVLVQHAGAVGGAHRFGDLCRQLKALGGGDGRQAASGTGPVRQGAKRQVGQLDEERRLLQIPVQHRDDSGLLTEGAAQQTVEGDLAFQAGECGGVQRELEDALLAAVLLASLPDLATTAATQVAQQPPAGSQRRVAADPQAEVGGRRWCRAELLDPDFRHQPVAVAVHGLDGFGGVSAQHLAQAAHRFRQYRVAEDAAGPDGVEHLVLGDHLAGVAQQIAQHLQGFALQIDCVPAHPQLQAGLVQYAVTEVPAQRAEVIAPIHGSSVGSGLLDRKRRCVDPGRRQACLRFRAGFCWGRRQCRLFSAGLR
nr:hypothetical protein [Stagnimonas aquatica]